MFTEKAGYLLKGPRSYLILILMMGLVIGCEEKDKASHNTSNQTKAEKTSQFETIFNGENLDGWDGDPRLWSVENGVIVGETSQENNIEENTFLIWEEGKPANFEVRFEYRFVEAGGELSGNSGLQFRSERFTTDDKPNLKYRVRGNQVDFAVSDWIPGLHYEEKKRGILARRGQRVVFDSEGEKQEERFAEEAELGKYIVHDEWNRYHVYANGDTMRAKINDHLMHEVIDHSSIPLDQGILAFQLHVGPPMRVELRNVELKVLN
ncbi:DUF1080 domain-containing protein [Aliifodinibius sp. S!AR15-10]|uniref:3-keto-disaccharide hydrolase n=1 Tax=Aliifodinibius sp. S!AR15-10 TaxID=2950437 RepID=UPI002865D561|nr:DUF1080 domain-containing protein [Aliifodinibius sp. S!AR15-10]MDR8394563.1 DUF1080 domain-containing protein [Aliifodinibius sp. S!AR15-10]